MISKEKKGKKEEKEKEGIEQKIIDLLSSGDGIPLYPEQLMVELNIPESEENGFRSKLDEMAQKGRLVQTKKKKYALPEELGYLTDS